ncbi:hypothetical protein BC835DRAFT_1311871 [Cytidiella melzeri]|nr:hypothetical protein BC835DRAFT_1311871 [Cytidiella melzeri]
MRLKNVWSFVPIFAKLKLFADRITLSKLTILYFAFSILHCLIQVGLQVEGFKVNENAAKFLNSVIVQGKVSQAGFAVLVGNQLRWCTSVPHSFNTNGCEVIWNGTETTNTTTALLNQAGSNSQTGASPSNVTLSHAPSPSHSSSASLAASSSGTDRAPLSTSVSQSATTTTITSASTSTTLVATSTAKATVSNLAQLQSALKSVEAGEFIATAGFNAPTATVTTKVAPTPSSTRVAQRDYKRSLLDIPKVISQLAVDGTTQVHILGLPGKPNEEVILTQSCLVALNWPLARVDNTKREDVVFIGFSLWVLGMSLVALLNESPPHIIASFLTHCLATGWSAFQLVSTRDFHTDFTRLATHGACEGVNLLPTYWTPRARFEITTLAFNALGLVISAVLSWKLMKSFGWQTFKRIGASLTISRAYRIILIFSIVIQLSVFFVVVSVALWVDQVYNGDIARLTTRVAMFKGVMITILFLMIPWLTIGWISVRREHKIPMLIFLMLAFGYTVGWSSMFAAPTFRWTFIEWRFFSLISAASVVLALVTFILGIICRCNFGKGLSRYLNAHQPLPGDDFEPAYPASSTSSFGGSYIDNKQWGSDEEKVDFPSYDTSIPNPTYAQVPPPLPAYMQTAPRTLGPRFYQAGSGIPFDQSAMSSNATMVTQSGSAKSPLSRQTSGSSQRSIGSMRSFTSNSSNTMRGMRWVIE